MATLNVYLRSSLGDKLIWTLSKNQGDAWKKAQVPLDSSDSQIQVGFGLMVHCQSSFGHLPPPPPFHI